MRYTDLGGIRRLLKEVNILNATHPGRSQDRKEESPTKEEDRQEWEHQSASAFVW